MRLPKHVTIIQLLSIVIMVLSASIVYYNYLLNKVYREVLPADKDPARWKPTYVYVDFSNLPENQKALLKIGDQDIDHKKNIIRAQILKIYKENLNTTYAKIKVIPLELDPKTSLYRHKVLQPFTPFVFQTDKYKVEGILLQPSKYVMEYQNPHVLKARLLLDTLPLGTDIPKGAVALDNAGRIIVKVLESHEKRKEISSINLGNGFQKKLKKNISTSDFELVALIKVGLVYNENSNNFYVEYNYRLQYEIAQIGSQIHLAIRDKWYNATILDIEDIEKL